MNGTVSTRTIDIVRASLDKRYAREQRFQWMGRAAVAMALLFLVLLLFSIVSNGAGAFVQTHVKLDIHFDPAEIDPDGTRERETLRDADYGALVRNALLQLFPEAEDDRRLRRQLTALVSSGADFRLREMVLKNPDLIGKTQPMWLLADDDVDVLHKGHVDREALVGGGRISAQQLTWLDRLDSEGRLGMRFNRSFFTAGDSREPEDAGIWGAVAGSFYTLIVTFLLSFPLGVATAVYLEEFAPRNKWTDLIEVNINNLAAVPSIVFGLLGLAVFLNFFGLPRSSPVVGGLVLSLMTLPVVIIAGRAALKSVPPSIREAALGVGASEMQTTIYHVLPLAMPGMLTGSIIGMARALGESAPLLMIGMVAFIVDVPDGFYSPSTVLPVQIFLWADSPERAFRELTAGAILVLLVFLLIMNAGAVLLRKRFERRW